MRTTKKLIVLCLAALMACVSMMPATFSWYAHNEKVVGNYMQYSRSGLPVSGSSSVNVSTIAVDKDGNKTNRDTTVSAVNFADTSTKIQYYKTTIDNTSGSGDIYGDLELGRLLNSAAVKAGITSPVINEKGFDVSKTPVTNDTVRIFFQPTKKWMFWYGERFADANSKVMLRYALGSETKDFEMTQIPDNKVPSSYKDACSEYSNEKAKIYYYDLPSNVDSFFFYNSRYYDDNDENNDYNRTKDIVRIEPGTLYRLTGELEDGGKLKTFDTYFTNNQAACMKYYSEVQLDMGGYIDISLKKTNDNNVDNFSPDYYGTGVTYSSSNTNVATVNSDGLVTAASNISTDTATANITTTITGACGDTITKTTKVTVSKYIEQMPVAQNILVEKGKKVELYWYVINKSGQTGDIASSIFWSY
jgi:hypothetical protein